MIKPKFNPKYFYLFSFVFIIEVLIAVFLNDSFIRPFVGDVLVIILMYTFIKTFFNCNKIKLLTGLLIFAFSVEISQYFHLVTVLNLQDYKIARVILGSTFDKMDFVAYVLGALVVVILNKKNN